MRKCFLACILAAMFAVLLMPCKASAAEAPPPETVPAESASLSFGDVVAGEQEQRAELRALLEAGVQKAPSGGTVSVSSATAKPGDTVKLNVSIGSNPGICSFILGFDYDSALTLKKVEFVPSALKLSDGVFSSDEGKGNFYFSKKAVWLYNSNSTYNGTWLTLTFEVKSTASDGDKPVKVTFSGGDITNLKEEAVSFTATAGKVTVSSETELDITKIVPDDVTVTGKGSGGKAVITVKSGKACVVASTTDGGSTYTKLTAVNKGSNTYEFTCPLASNMKFIVLLKGDVTGDKKINNQDVAREKQIANSVGKPATAQQKLAGDVIGTGDKINNQDVAKLKQAANNVGAPIAW